ncbi:zinc metalloproteinase nas-7-like [Artemia franciscana]|uniref:zinc metalloproteinase nas-7-like n=1 Tax=Artemia franciscana TaxID=6661 RepID=UPI0032DBA3DC
MYRFYLLTILNLALSLPFGGKFNSKQYPWEQGPYLQGDIKLTEEQAKNGLINERYRWVDATVPYVISGDFTPQQLAIIEASFEEYHTKTCVKFVPRTDETDYIDIQSEQTGCWSYIGRIGNVQVVNLQTGSCVLYTGTPIHELMHAIGFYHEQSRWDRDDYVTILEENIEADKLHNFNKYDEDRITAFGQPYDWGSVMHYSEYAFSNNGEPTIVSKPEGIPLGNDEGLTDVDAAKINAMYNC